MGSKINHQLSKPQVKDDYYVKAVQCCNGSHQRVRADMVTENIYIEQMQKLLRRNHDDIHFGGKKFIWEKIT